MATKILNSVRSFTESIIDYAGLFPPARLKLTEAFDNYIKYKNGQYSWLVSKFICPAKILPELDAIIKKDFKDESDISISVLSSGGSDEKDFNDNLTADLNAWKAFNAEFGERINTSFFETRLPDEIILKGDYKRTSEFLDMISDKISANISRPVYFFTECVTGEDWKEGIKSLINAIGLHNEKFSDCGFKLRTGGPEPFYFPPPELITLTIRECLDRKTPLKFTAGLHHPFRHYDPEIRTMMYGFINVFAAGILAMRHNVSDSDLREILDDENPDNFIFTDADLSWKGWTADIKDIEFARKNLVASFGSCSVDEPVSDLESIKLL